MIGHAFKLLEEASFFIERHTPIAGNFHRSNFARIDTPQFPPIAIREALINALIHRDYSIRGGAVSVAIYDDRMEIVGWPFT